MKVVLIKAVLENGSVKTTIRRGRLPIFWEPGAVIDVSDATGAKFIASGHAQEIQAPAEEVAE